MLTVQQLTKTFPNGKGIFDVSFSVKKGEVFGFLGSERGRQIDDDPAYHGIHETGERIREGWRAGYLD